MEASPASHRTRVRIARPRALLARLSDDRLVELARGGERAAFAVIYDRHSPGLLSFAAQILGSRSEAEDVVQHAMLAVHNEVEGTRYLRVKPWLYTVARNRAVSLLRVRREQPLDRVDEPTVAGVAGAVERSDELRSVLQDLARLPEDQRTALVLSELGDLNHAEIASVLGCDTPKVKSLVFQARSGLMASRAGRETDCTSIREQLSTLTGGALRRREIREHLRICEGCREFRDEVRSQRAQLALVLPIIPSAGLRDAVLAAAGTGGTGGLAVVAGGGATIVGGKVAAALVAGALAAAGVGVAVTRDNSNPGRSAAGGAGGSIEAPSPAPDAEAGSGDDANGRSARADGKQAGERISDSLRRERRRSHDRARSAEQQAVAEAPAPVEAPAPPSDPVAGSESQGSGSNGSEAKASAPGQIRATEVSKGANGAAQSSAHSQSGGGGSKNEIHASNAGGGGSGGGAGDANRSAQGAAHANSGGGGSGSSNAGGQGSNAGGKSERSAGGGKPEK